MNSMVFYNNVMQKKFKPFIKGKNAKLFRSLFNNKSFSLNSHKDSSWHVSLLCLEICKRDFVITELTKQGIETRPIVSGNFLKNPVEKYYDYSVYRSSKYNEYR